MRRATNASLFAVRALLLAADAPLVSAAAAIASASRSAHTVAVFMSCAVVLGKEKKNEDEEKQLLFFLCASIPHWWNILSTGSNWWRKDFVTTQSTHTNKTFADHQGLSLELWVLADVVASASWPPVIMD